jgi:DNA replication protein DnaC
MSRTDTYVPRFAELNVEPVMGGVSIVSLAELHQQPDHPANKVVEFECSQGCGTMLRGRYFFSPITACDACREKYEAREKLDRAKTYWDAICPEQFRETEKAHPGFPRAQYEATRAWSGGESLCFLGATGKGKTRLGMVLLKRCLVKHNLHVGVMWPEQLRSVKSNPKTLDWVVSWGRFDVLLIDDPLLVGAADSRITESFKDLLDYRLRHKRVNIVTSQIDGTDYEQAAGKFGNGTKADKEVIAALLRRLREQCRVVSFADVTPKVNEQHF